MHILDIDEVLALPSWKLEEWKAYFRICENMRDEYTEQDEKYDKAKNAAKNGGWN